MDRSLLGLCFDTGHCAFGGGDPLGLLRDARALVNHVHFKDVDLALLARMHAEGKGLEDAWAEGVFCELGTGGAHVEECLDELVRGDYDGWIVVEQDRVLGPGAAVHRRARGGGAKPRVAARAWPLTRATLPLRRVRPSSARRPTVYVEGPDSNGKGTTWPTERAIPRFSTCSRR